MDERETEIFLGLQVGDEQAFEKLFNLLYPQVRFFVEQIIKDGSESEDITMHALLMFWKKGISEFQAFGQVKAFIFKTAKNASLNFLKQSKVHRTHQRNLVYLSSAIDDKIADQAMYKIEMLQILYHEIDKLPPQTREAFKMVFLEDLPRPVVAEKLNISLSTVNNLCATAKNKLRRIFSEKELIVLLLLIKASMN